MNELKISTNLVNAIFQYLGSRPYAEVFQLVEAIQEQQALITALTARITALESN
jgi:hypothetical protein